MAQPVLVRPPAAPTALGAALDQLDRSREGLTAARAATTPAERYVAAHLAALRAAAAVLAVRGRPAGGRRGRTLNVWELLPRVAPELGEWAIFFATSASRRAAVEAGRVDVVSARDADDLLRDAEAFALVVAEILGVPRELR
jgi:hypothetical protein